MRLTSLIILEDLIKKYEKAEGKSFNWDLEVKNQWMTDKAGMLHTGIKSSEWPTTHKSWCKSKTTEEDWLEVVIFLFMIGYLCQKAMEK